MAASFRSFALLAAFDELDAHTPAPTLEACLRGLAAGLRGADPLYRELIRAEAIARLERRQIRAPARLVDAALAGQRVAAGDGDAPGRRIALNDPAPWPEPVDGAALLDEVLATLTRYIALPPGAAPALALWILHAHAQDASEISPYLALVSPLPRCGKTTTIQLTAALVPRPLAASNITAAALFRTVEKYVPTLLVDEADTFVADATELRGLLNAGHTRATAFAVRTVGEDHEPRLFSTWCPKVLALIGTLPSTLEDRSIVVPMRRRARANRSSGSGSTACRRSSRCGAERRAGLPTTSVCFARPIRPLQRACMTVRPITGVLCSRSRM